MLSVLYGSIVDGNRKKIYVMIKARKAKEDHLAAFRRRCKRAGGAFLLGEGNEIYGNRAAGADSAR